MTPENSLIELLDRVACLQGASALINAEELALWSSEAVAAMKAQKLITKAQPAASAVCPGCEEECVMPVHTIPVPSGEPAIFVACDKRGDISRVSVPIPKPVSLGGRAVGWIETEVNDWLNQQIEASRKAGH